MNNAVQLAGMGIKEPSGDRLSSNNNFISENLNHHFEKLFNDSVSKFNSITEHDVNSNPNSQKVTRLILKEKTTENNFMGVTENESIPIDCSKIQNTKLFLNENVQNTIEGTGEKNIDFDSKSFLGFRVDENIPTPNIKLNPTIKENLFQQDQIGTGIRTSVNPNQENAEFLKSETNAKQLFNGKIPDNLTEILKNTGSIKFSENPTVEKEIPKTFFPLSGEEKTDTLKSLRINESDLKNGENFQNFDSKDSTRYEVRTKYNQVDMNNQKTPDSKLESNKSGNALRTEIQDSTGKNEGASNHKAHLTSEKQDPNLTQNRTNRSEINLNPKIKTIENPIPYQQQETEKLTDEIKTAISRKLEIDNIRITTEFEKNQLNALKTQASNPKNSHLMEESISGAIKDSSDPQKLKDERNHETANRVKIKNSNSNNPNDRIESKNDAGEKNKQQDMKSTLESSSKLDLNSTTKVGADSNTELKNLFHFGKGLTNNSGFQQVDKSFGSEILESKNSVMNLNEKDVLNQVLRKVVFNVKNQAGEFYMKLEPEFLGSVRFRVQIEGDNLSARVFTNTHIAKDILEQNSHILTNALTEQGMKVEKFQVEVSDQQSENFTNFDENSKGNSEHEDQIFNRQPHQELFSENPELKEEENKIHKKPYKPYGKSMIDIRI